MLIIGKNNLKTGENKKVQVSLAIRGGYVPEKFRTANTKTGSLGLN